MNFREDREDCSHATNPVVRAISLRAALINNIELFTGCTVDTLQRRSDAAVASLRQYAREMEAAHRDQHLIRKKANIVSKSVVDIVNNFHKILMYFHDVNNKAAEYVMSDKGKDFLTHVQTTSELKPFLVRMFSKDTMKTLGGMQGIVGHIKGMYEHGITTKSSIQLIGSLAMCVTNWLGVTEKGVEHAESCSLFALELEEFANTIEDTTAALMNNYNKCIHLAKTREISAIEHGPRNQNKSRGTSVKLARKLCQLLVINLIMCISVVFVSFWHVSQHSVRNYDSYLPYQ